MTTPRLARPPLRTAAFFVGAACAFTGAVSARQHEEPVGPTRAEVEATARRIERSVAERDPAVFDALLSMERVVDRAARGLDVDPELLAGFRAGVEEGDDYAQRLVDDLGLEGTYRLLGLRADGAATTALFRVLSDEGGLNYHELRFARDDQGAVCVDDVLVYASGESISDTLRRALLTTVAAQDPARRLRATAEERAEFQTLLELGRVQALRGAGRHEAALRRLLALPESAQRSKLVLLVRFQIAEQVSEEAYLESLEALEAALPGDPIWLLVGIDAGVLRGRYDDALACVDGLERRLGLADPYLDALRASILAGKGDHGRARERIEAALAAEPDNPESWYLLVDVALAAGDWDALARDLTRCEGALDVVFELEDVPEFAAFVASEAYRRWLAEREGR